MVSTADRVLRWYRMHCRSLPWRVRPTPYGVWVSELMLQQTRVAAVVPHYQRFLQRFPTVEALAQADEQDVLAAWSGLGYYRRAKSLHRAAQMVVSSLGGLLPTDLEGWLALPGVGRYTAGAILSIALGERVPIVDGNVARVLCRLFGLRGDPGKPPTRDALWRIAEDLLPESFAGDFNQGMMELGALVCTPRAPRCLVCPLRDECVARAKGIENELPEVAPRRRSVSVTMAAGVVERGTSVLLYRRRQEGLMKDLWEFPGGECNPAEQPRDALVREARERYGLDLAPKQALARVRHSVMHKRITLYAFAAEVEPTAGPGEIEERNWVLREEIHRVPVSSMVLKVLRAARGQG